MYKLHGVYVGLDVRIADHAAVYIHGTPSHNIHPLLTLLTRINLCPKIALFAPSSIHNRQA